MGGGERDLVPTKSLPVDMNLAARDVTKARTAASANQAHALGTSHTGDRRKVWNDFLALKAPTNDLEPRIVQRIALAVER